MEIYVPVQGYNGRYLVSNMGNMKCLSRKKDSYVTMRGYVDHRGYRRVDLEGKEHLVHRLVAFHFIPNPEPKKLSIIKMKTNLITGWKTSNG